MSKSAERKRTIIALSYPLAIVVLLVLAGLIAYLTKPIYQGRAQNHEETEPERVVPSPDEVAGFGGHRYQIIRQRLTWDQARERCEQMGGHLACITSKKENEFLWKLAKRHSFPRHTTCWLGGTDTEQESQWRWITGEPFELTQYLAAGSDRGENYLNLRLETGRWEDYPLEGETAGEQWFACEWEK